MGNNVVDIKESEFKSSKTKLVLAAEGIFRLAKGFGYTVEESKTLCKLKKKLFKDTDEYEDQLRKREYIKIGRLLPLGMALSAVEWFEIPKDEREASLWHAGIDVKGKNYMEDVLCTTVGSNQFCGFCVYGQERTDDEWITKLDEDGNKVSSLEAQMANKGDEEYTKDIRTLGGIVE